MTTRPKKDVGERGLPSLAQARQERRRALVFGKVRFRAMTPRFWLWTATGFAVFGVVYWKISQGQLESAKSKVMAKQRAVAQSLEPKIRPFSDKIEAWVMALASNFEGEHVADDLDLTKVEKGPGVYLRLRLENAKTSKDIRKASRRSLQDGFTSCMFVKKARLDPRSGPKCTAPADCDPGLLCNEWGVCAKPTQPYNLRLAYGAMGILSNEWSDELHEASSELAVRVYDRDLDRVTHDDVPIAIEILSRARYFTLVLDEDPPAGLPPPLEIDGGAPELEEQRIQRSEHAARVGIWDLQNGALLVRTRGDAAGRFVPMGKQAVQDPVTMAAQQRQVNSCALAGHVKSAVGRARAATVKPPVDGGAPDGGNDSIDGG